MADYSKIVSGNSINNNNSTIANAGTVASNATSVSPSNLSAVTGRRKVPGPVMDTTNVGVFPIVSGANHAELVAGAYVGFGYTTQLAGQTSTPLNIIGTSAGATPKGIYGTSGVYTTDYVDWSYVSGVVTSSTDQLDYMDEDKSALVTRTLPGYLTYMETGATPTNDTYNAKTNG